MSQCPAVVEVVTGLQAVQHHAAAAALCEVADACEVLDPTLRMLYASSLVALGRDLDAQAQLAPCTTEPEHSSKAFRMLAEIALRRGDRLAAAVFARDAW